MNRLMSSPSKETGESAAECIEFIWARFWDHWIPSGSLICLRICANIVLRLNFSCFMPTVFSKRSAIRNLASSEWPLPLLLLLRSIGFDDDRLCRGLSWVDLWNDRLSTSYNHPRFEPCAKHKIYNLHKQQQPNNFYSAHISHNRTANR